MATRLRVRIGDLPAKLRISRASLFSYRAGKNPISEKAWQKLELAERESGISRPLHEQLASAHENRQKGLIASASLDEIVRLLTLLPRAEQKWIVTTILDAQIDSIEANLNGFLLDAEALSNLAETKASKSELKFFAQKVRQSVRSSRDLLQLLVLQLRTALGLDTRSLVERIKETGASGNIKSAKASSMAERKRPSKRKR